MLCCGAIAVPTAVIATVLAGCACVFPVLRKSTSGTESYQTLWAFSNVTGDTVSTSKVSDSSCWEYRTYFMGCESAAILSGALGLAMLVIIIIHAITKGKLFFLKITSLVIALLAVIASGACVGLIILGYLKGYCQEDDALKGRYAPFEERGYTFDFGFYAICASCGLFLLSLIPQCCL
ncbi:putative Amastin surface glycoprotein [Trypanosoma vivax]|nr:putative Amastin surface glycoprotein [Trypanosoma vivax]